jgi:hypothetical protein
MISTVFLRLGLMAFIMALAGGAAGAETYRWMDEDGVTHYSDQVPPDQVKHRRTRLNSQGLEVGTIEAPKTAEQLRREQQLRQLRAQQEKILAAQRDQDRALLRTYRSVEEMYAALQGKLDTLDGSAKITEANRQRQKELLAGQERRAADLERQGQTVPQSLRDLISAPRRQILAYDEKLRDIQADKNAISAQFAKDIARFQAIQAMQAKNQGEPSGASLSITADRGGKDGIIISAIACAVGTVCDRAWELARDYVARNSSAPLSVDTDKVIQTPNPVNDRDFGMTVTRIVGRSEDILFLDVRCRPSSIGEELCSSPRIGELRANFKAFIEAGIGSSAAGGLMPGAR